MNFHAKRRDFASKLFRKCPVLAPNFFYNFLIFGAKIEIQTKALYWAKFEFLSIFIHSFEKTFLASFVHKKFKENVETWAREKKVTPLRGGGAATFQDVQGEKLGHTKDWIEVLLTRWWGSFDRWRANHFWKKKNLLTWQYTSHFQSWLTFSVMKRVKTIMHIH